MKFQKRLLRAEPNFQILTKLWQVNWLYVLLICALAVVGYGALYSAGGGTPRPFAGPQSIRFCFGLVMMLGLALMSPGILVRMAWPLYIFSILLLVAVLRMGHVGKGRSGGSCWAAYRCSHRNWPRSRWCSCWQAGFTRSATAGWATRCCWCRPRSWCCCR